MKAPLLPRLVFALCGLLGTFGAVAAAQAQTKPSDSSDQKKNVAYRLARTDKLTVTIIGETDPGLNASGKRVDVNGNINLGLVQDVHVAGLTVPEAQTAIENAYKDGRYLRNPQVTITIEEYAPRTVSVSGIVKFPATIAMPPETTMTLKDVILKAGGLGDTANGKNVRISRKLPDGSTKVFTKNVSDSLYAKDTSDSSDANFVIEPDDTIYVPEKIF